MVSPSESPSLLPSALSETFVDSVDSVDWIDWIDRTVDTAFAPLRGLPGPDAIASVASALGDHGLVWFLLALARARRPGRRRTVAMRALVFTGAFTPLVNAGLKAAVGRVRPEDQPARPLPVRIPRTTSFPSGHALAAWCAATLLDDDDAWAPAYYAMATIISVSRVHARLHHTTDVLAGSLLGILLGRLGRLLFPVKYP
ncbi:MAG: phosphatase PAP2 family protein [Acidimicrobiales bacterium]